MPSLKGITSAFCFCLLFTLCAVSAKADTTYTYMGPQFNDFRADTGHFAGFSENHVRTLSNADSTYDATLRSARVNQRHHMTRSDNPQSAPDSMLENRVRQRAQEIWERRERDPQMFDWLLAEAEIQTECGTSSSQADKVG